MVGPLTLRGRMMANGTPSGKSETRLRDELYSATVTVKNILVNHTCCREHTTLKQGEHQRGLWLHVSSRGKY